MFKLAAVVASQVSRSTLQCSVGVRDYLSSIFVTGEYKYSFTIFYQFLLIAHGPMALRVILCPSSLTFLSLCHSHSGKSSLSKQEQWFKPHLYNPLLFFFFFLLNHWSNVGVENSTQSDHHWAVSIQIKGMCGICCQRSDMGQKMIETRVRMSEAIRKRTVAPHLPSLRPLLAPLSERTKAL